MADLLAEGVVGDEVIVLVAAQQGEGADLIDPAAVAEGLVPLPVVLEVLKGDLPVVADGLMDGVNIVIHPVVHGLDPAGHKDLTLEPLSQMPGGKLLQLFNELTALPGGNELGGLDGVYQQL